MKNKLIGGGGFHHIALKVADFDRSVSFYTNGLGFSEKITWGEPGKRAIMLDTGDGNYLEIFEGGSHGRKGDEILLHFALRTNDCDAAVERARQAGAQIVNEAFNVDIDSKPHRTPVRIAFCKGPDGEVIEWFQNELT